MLGSILSLFKSYEIEAVKLFIIKGTCNKSSNPSGTVGKTNQPMNTEILSVS